MPKVLLDQNVPVGLVKMLSGHEVRTAFRMGWANLTNGELIAAAEREDFEVMVTGDLRLQYQQSLGNRRLAIVVLGTNHWASIRVFADEIRNGVGEATAGSYRIVEIERIRRRTRGASQNLD